MKLYDVEGNDQPLMLSEEHAELIGATEHDLADEAMPARTASKAAWVAWAVGYGADPAVADASTKADLIAQYGG
jgi:hypothetical protein